MKTGLSLPPSKWSFVGLYPWKNFVVPWQKAGDVYKSSSMGKDGERERDARNSMKRIKLLRYCHVYIYMCIYIYSVRIYIYTSKKKSCSRSSCNLSWWSFHPIPFWSDWFLSPLLGRSNVLKRPKRHIRDICATRRWFEIRPQHIPLHGVFVGCQIHEICKPLTPAPIESQPPLFWRVWFFQSWFLEGPEDNQASATSLHIVCIRKYHETKNKRALSCTFISQDEKRKQKMRLNRYFDLLAEVENWM